MAGIGGNGSFLQWINAITVTYFCYLKSTFEFGIKTLSINSGSFHWMDRLNGSSSFNQATEQSPGDQIQSEPNVNDNYFLF